MFSAIFAWHAMRVSRELEQINTKMKSGRRRPNEMITKAKVTLTVEVTVNSSWGAECSVQQVFKQAREEAICQVKSNVKNCAIIGEPQVIAMTNTADFGE